MQVRAGSLPHLTYCLNIHPGETWAEVTKAVDVHARRVRDLVCPGRPFGLGLRIGAAAAAEAEAGAPAFRDALARADLYAFTVNGFPYGPFHGAAVKRRVYEPDWTTAARRDYTASLARFLAGVLPPGSRAASAPCPAASAGRTRRAAARTRWRAAWRRRWRDSRPCANAPGAAYGSRSSRSRAA